MTSSASQPYSVDWRYIKKLWREITASEYLKEKIDAIPEVVDNVHNRATDKALSANMWRLLQDQIDELKTPWRFLGNWNSSTWLSEVSLSNNPYVYWNWDYFIVSVVSNTTNYKPNWDMYVAWIASDTVEEDTVNIDDRYMFNWNSWIYIPSWQRTFVIDTELSNTSTNVVENRVITAKFETVDENLDSKANASSGVTWEQPAWNPGDIYVDEDEDKIYIKWVNSWKDISEWWEWWWTIYTAWEWININNNIISNEYANPYVIFNNNYNKKDKNHRLRILTFGSSWFCCTWLYLNKILNNLWIKNEIHWYYMWHSQFNEWLAFFNWDMSPVQWSEATRQCWQYISVDWADWTIRWAWLNTSSTYTYETIARTTFAQDWRKDLTENKWDIIILQQWAHQACNPIYWENQEAYIKMVKQFATTDTVIWFNSTWAPWTNWTWIATDTNYLPTPATNDVAWQHVFLSEHLKRVKDLMMKTWILNISPSWLVLQMLRENNSSWDSYPNWDYTRDQLHPTNWLPMFAIASTLYQSIISPITWIHIKNCTWVPTESMTRTPFSPSYYVPMTLDKAYTVYNYVDSAIANRFTVIPETFSLSTWNATIDVADWWTASLTATSWTFNNEPVNNTLNVNPLAWNKIKSITLNGKVIPVIDWVNSYQLQMTYGYNLIEVDFEEENSSSPSYSITTNITHWELGLNPSTIRTWATITFEPEYLAWDYPQNVTVTWASYTYDNATWTIELSNPTSNVTVNIVCPQKEVVENEAITVPTSLMSNRATMTITNARFAFSNTTLSAGNNRISVAADESLDVPQEGTPDRVRAAIFVPSGKKITFHLNDAWASYTWWAACNWLNASKPNAASTRPSWWTNAYWRAVYWINWGYTNINPTIFNWTDDVYLWTINPNPQQWTDVSTYFPYNNTNDMVIENSSTEPIFVRLVFYTSASSVNLTYTYTSL